MDLKTRYKYCCDDYVKAFAEWMGFSLDYFWVSDNAGTVLFICDYYVDFDNVRLVVDNAIHPDTFFEWYGYCELCVHQDVPDINLRTWCKLTKNKQKSIIKALRRDESNIGE